MSALLEIEDLRAGYGDHEILRGVELRVDEGEIVSIIGPNGAGKSTLLRTIAGLLPPRGGDVRFQGRSIRGATPEAIIAMGLCYVPQEANVFPGLSVDENLLIGIGRRPAGKRRARGRSPSCFPSSASAGASARARSRAASARCSRSRWR